MRDTVRNVLQFQIAAGEPIGPYPLVPQDWQRHTTANLILESFMKTMKGMGYEVVANPNRGGQIELVEKHEPNLVETLDGVLDTSYVATAGGNIWGLPLVEGWDEIHKTNMLKRNGHGFFDRRSDGKVKPPEDWQPPRLEKIIKDSIERGTERERIQAIKTDPHACSLCGQRPGEDGHCGCYKKD